MEEAPKLRDDPVPRTTRTYVEETTYRESYDNQEKTEILGEINSEQTEDPYLNKIRWSNRRRMAWVSLFALISQVAISILIIITTDASVEKIKVLAELLAYPSIAFASVIGAYMGFTTWAARK